MVVRRRRSMQLAESRGTHKASFEGCEMLLKKRSEAFQNRCFAEAVQKCFGHLSAAVDDDGDEGVTTVQSGQLAKSGWGRSRDPAESTYTPVVAFPPAVLFLCLTSPVADSLPNEPTREPAHVQRNQERAQFLHLRQRVRRFSVNPPLTPRSKKGQNKKTSHPSNGRQSARSSSDFHLQIDPRFGWKNASSKHRSETPHNYVHLLSGVHATRPELRSPFCAAPLTLTQKTHHLGMIPRTIVLNAESPSGGLSPRSLRLTNPPRALPPPPEAAKARAFH
ncbi:hypothetical protein CIHG_04457 [Coccidioides immitis H538.4]|uniref:Uncharacterized protein n=1 Tax=Coccidioides immitis H538.4 TaxID=396776 RepID=A0A0J8UGY5_COCIT|nr:hypothetical protein CIHG_04457 [Coccidioides immitis H538.4]